MGNVVALRLHKKRKGVLSYRDNTDARSVAMKMELPVSGTLGIFVLAVRNTLLTLEQANALLNDLIKAGFRAPLDKLDKLV